MGGWVDGKDDGGIDGFYTFVNGTLVQDPNHFPWPRKGATLDIFIFNCKHKDSFKQEPLNTLFPTIEEILDFQKSPADFNGQYSAQLIKMRDIATTAYRRTASASPELHFHFIYASRGETVESNIEARGNQLKRIVSDYFSNATVNLEYVGAIELINLHRKSRFTLELPFAEQLSGDQGAYVLLVDIQAYACFVSDEQGNLRRYLFDSNVRDFLGETRINQDIAKSLEDPTAPDFWWLNNGVTILATQAIPLGKTTAGNVLKLHDVQIVNGLQTTHAIHNCTKNLSFNEPRRVLVKVIVSEDLEIRDQIIRSTNNQSTVELASLTATDKIQRDIEAILEKQNWYYERRKNYYKNIGKPTERFIEPMFLAIGMVSLIRKSPRIASKLKSRFMQDRNSYSSVFNDALPILVWPKIASIMKTVEAAISKNTITHRPSSRMRAGWRGATALCVVAEVLSSFSYSIEDLIKLDEDALNKDRIGEIYKFLTQYTTEKIPEIPQKTPRSRVQNRVEEFAIKQNISGIECVERWSIPTKFGVSGPSGQQLALNLKGSKLHQIAPKLLDPFILEDVYKHLPPQPWQTGTHKIVATKTGISEKIVSKAIRQLVVDGKVYDQVDGVVFDTQKTIVAIDLERADSKYKIGDKFTRQKSPHN